MSIRLGYQIPNFSYGTPVVELFPTVVAQAREAEAAGFDAVFVMDHFYQLPGIGTPDQPMLECLHGAGGAGDGDTDRIQLSALVTGNTYRNPAHAGQDRDDAGRGQRGPRRAGIGAGWFELEHRQLGLRVRHLHRPVRAARRVAVDHRADAARRAADGRRQVVPHRERDERAPAARRPADPARRRRREEDVRAWPPATPSTSTSSASPPTCRASWRRSTQRCAEAGRDRSTLETSFLASVSSTRTATRRARMQRELPARTRRRPRRAARPSAAVDPGPAVRRHARRGRRRLRTGCSTTASTA